MLRVFLPGPPRADRPDAWVRYGGDGRPIDRGRDAPSRWPADARTEAVLAADQMRLIALALPPMPRERLQAAARFALEDQVAGDIEDASIALADRHDGSYVAAVASASSIRAIAGHARRFARIIPESALAPRASGWTWYASGSGSGFVRRADGSAFAVGNIAPAQPALPAELAAALAQAVRTHSAPAAVHVAFAADAATLASWSQTAAVPFVAAPAWQWEQATPATFGAAPDFLHDASRAAPANASLVAPAYRPALLLAALAVAIYLGGLVVQWSWLALDDWRLSRALVAEAKAAQLPDATTPAAAFAAITHRNAALRHRAREAAPADALPLLARAAPSLGALPPGALRLARYAGDAWTIELGKLDPVALSRTTRNLADAGVDALSAASASGTRMRLSLAPTAP